MAIFSVNLKNALQTNLFEFGRRFDGGPEPVDHDPEYWTRVRDKSYLGTPVFTPLEIKGGSYLDENGNTVTFEGMFIDCVLMTVNQSKIIEKTLINGRRGSVKEFISDNDFTVNMKIVLASPHSSIFPEEATTRLISILRAPVALEVVSAYLNMYEIYSIVIDSYNNPQRQGFQNLSMFDINASSDEPLELQLIQ